MPLEIRAPRPEDIGPITEIVNLPKVRAGTLRLPYTSEGFVRQRLMEPGPLVSNLIAELDGAVAGQGTLMRNAGRRAHAGSVFLFVADPVQRRGVGRALMSGLLDLADNWFGLRRVQLEVNWDNAGAIALYQEMGFEIEGTLRGDTLRDGVLIDSYVMGRLRPAPVHKGASA